MDHQLMHLELHHAFWTELASCLRDLEIAGHAMVREPTAPSWYFAQRVMVAAVRRRGATIDPAWHESARRYEASTLLRLRDFANQRAAAIPATTRAGKRARKRLQALARFWHDDANLLLHGESN